MGEELKKYIIPEQPTKMETPEQPELLKEQKERNEQHETITVEQIPKTIKDDVPMANKEPLNASALVTNMKSEIQKQYNDNKSEIIKSDDFKNITREITERSAKAQLSKDMLEILNEEQKNALTAHILKCEQIKIEYRTKKEKKIILEEIKADLEQKRTDALKKRYGYLYLKDEKDELMNFIPKKSYNVCRELSYRYSGTSDTFRKVVKTTLKTVFWVGISALLVYLLYTGFSWVISNTQNLPNV